MKRIDAICVRYEVPLAAAAIQFPLGHPNVASIIPGAVNVAEVERNTDYVELPIPRALWDKLKTKNLSSRHARAYAGQLRAQAEPCDGEWRQREVTAAVCQLSALKSFRTRSAGLESARVEYGNSRPREIDTLDRGRPRLRQQIREPEFDAVGGLERHGLHVAGR